MLNLFKISRLRNIDQSHEITYVCQDENYKLGFSYISKYCVKFTDRSVIYIWQYCLMSVADKLGTSI